MLKYVNFLLFNIVRKWAIWVLLILSLAISYFVIWIQIHELKKYSIEFVDSMNIYTKMMPFIFGTSFVSMITVYVFKDGEDDGSDLLIISKPVSRGKILLSKFAVISLLIFVYNLIYFVTVFVAAQHDAFAPMMDRFKFAISILIGGITVSFIVGTIIIFASSFLSKMGALAIGIVSAAVFPIVSQIVATVAKGTPTKGNSGYRRRLHVVNAQETERLVENTLENYMQTGEPEIGVSDLTRIGRRQYQLAYDNQIDKMQAYIEEVWYDKAAYVDPWYQLSGFYDLFTDPPFLSADPQEFQVEHKKAHLSEEEAIEKTTTGQRLSIPVDIMTGNEINTDKLIDKVLRILSGKEKTLILTKNSIPGTTPGKVGSMSWKDLIHNIQRWMNNKPLDDHFEPIPIINFFLDSKYSFEDRVRAISTSDNFDEDGKSTGFVGAFTSYSLQEYLTHILVLDALKNSTKFIQKINAMKGVSDKTKLLATSIATTLRPYQAPEKAFDFYQPHGTPPQNPMDIYDSVTHEIKEDAGYYEYLKTLKDQDGNPFSRSMIDGHMQTYGFLQGVGIIPDGEERWIATTKPYISRGKTLEIWTYIGLFFMFITGIRYWRKDIK